MKVWYLVIPIIFGIFAGIFLAYSITDEKPSMFKASELIKGGSPIMGDVNAKITILEWGDYQCTFCYKFHKDTLDSIKEDFIKTGKVNLVFKDYPLNGIDSHLAAQASYCADDQEKYWQYHDQIYQNWAGERTGWVTRDSLEKFAQTLNLDIKKFNECLDEKKYAEKVENLYAAGKEIGIDATPSFLVFDDQRIIKIIGNQPLQVFLMTIDELG